MVDNQTEFFSSTLAVDKGGQESVRTGRVIEVGALKFDAKDRNGVSREQRLVTTISTALQRSPGLDLLVTPEYCLYYQAAGVQMKDNTSPIPFKTVGPLPDSSADPGDKYSFMINSSFVELHSEETSKQPIEFEEVPGGHIRIVRGDDGVISTLSQIQELAKSHGTSISLGTVCEKQIIDGIEVYWNTLLVIDSSGKIVQLRRKSDSCWTPDLTVDEHERVRLGKTGIEGDTHAMTVLREAYQQSKADIRPIDLSSKQGSRYTVLPIICSERSQTEAHLRQISEPMIDVVAMSIAEGDDLINNVVAAGHGIEGQKLIARYGSEQLRKHNQHGVYVMSDAAGEAAGIFALSDGRIQSEADNSVVRVMKVDVG